MCAVNAPHFEHGSLVGRCWTILPWRSSSSKLGGSWHVFWFVQHWPFFASLLCGLTFDHHNSYNYGSSNTWELFGFQKLVNVVIPAMLITQDHGEREKRYWKWESFAHLKRYCQPLCYWHDAPFIFIFKKSFLLSHHQTLYEHFSSPEVYNELGRFGNTSFLLAFVQPIKNIYVVAPQGRTSPQCLGNQNKIHLNPSLPTKGI